MKRTTETDLKRAVYTFLTLTYPDGVFWIGNAGMRFYEAKGKKYAIKLGPTGSPDVAGMLPPDGRFIGVETKMPGKKQTPAQKEWQIKTERAGGLYIVAYNLDDVAWALNGA